MWELIALAGLGLLASGRRSGPTRSDGPSPTPASRRVSYRTRDGRADYQFSIEQQNNGGYRTYIASQPSYGNRPTGAHPTHRQHDGAGRPFVCWSTPIASEQDALRVSAAWADATQEYIKTGRRF
jgi:hypothetical protein